MDSPRRSLNNRALIDSTQQLDQHMKARSDTMEAQVWEMSAGAKTPARHDDAGRYGDASQMAVERSCFDELCQGQLFGRRRAVVCLLLSARDIGHEVRRDHEPAETKGWRQHLAG